MSVELENMFGFELLYKAFSDQIHKKEDVLIVFVHWYFIKNGFKCLGIGDSKTIDPAEIGSELLPDEWNNKPNYTLRYVREGKLYILVGIKSEAILLLNLLRIEDHSVSNVQFPLETVKELKGPLNRILPNYETILKTLKKDLVEPVYLGTGHEVSTQTSDTSDRPQRSDDDDDPLRVGPPHRPAGDTIPGLPRMSPFGIGRDDLNPFGTGQGGMIFNPFSGPRPRPAYPGLGVPGRLPLASIPPGARYDPFGPPDIAAYSRLGPDPDHMPPPGYDDMFM
ncbi:proteasome inhibitor PI31 subunit [Phymastichus coffea]|uniref:proteasome inhibitor PI31 subunit n=1 Tax=Phymastichus coffea TaxID=108790 RepID=UPI00273BE246|nr:proteasome inhibitor PI31 subunit [Phymastichus coffea]